MPRSSFAAAAAVLVVVVTHLSSLAHAQTVPSALPAGGGARPAVQAARVSGSIRIDGRLDESAWSSASVAASFTEAYPREGAPAAMRTEARILYDDDALYVAMRMFDSAPDSIGAQLARRDAGSAASSDWAQVMIDSYNDRRTAASFAVNPRGVKRDVYLSNDVNEDFGWDAVWDVATRIDSAGWTAEFRIPFSQLRFSRTEPAGGRTWGLQFTRDVARTQSRSLWAPWLRKDNAFVSRFGSLTGLTGVRASNHLEVLPYTLAQVTRAPDEPGNPFYRENRSKTSLGADLRYGLKSGFNLNATINPDFGQVELDPAFVNLSAFEVQLPERRPFFVEGTDIFRFGGLLSYISQGSPQFFYSRRIGRTPQRNLNFENDVSFTDAPTASTILGAVKLTGKTSNGWTVGLLDAVTSRETGRVFSSDDREFSTPVEPRSNYLVGRVRKDLNRGATVIGGIATAASRHLRDSVFQPMLRSQAYVTGVDAEHSWGDRMWAVSGFVAGSAVRGSEGAIAATQRSSARYFARPDADYLTYDSTRTSLGGYVAGAALRKGGAWRGSVWYQEVSPGLEVNDLGIYGRADSRAVSGLFGRRNDKPGPIFRDWFVRTFTSQRWNYGGDRMTNNVAFRGTGTFNNLWNANATIERGFDTFNDRLTRGGPVTAQPGFVQIESGFGSDPRRRFSGDIYTQVYRDDADGNFRYVGIGFSARPTSTIQVSLTPTYEEALVRAQYVRARTDANATATYGRRYVFADLDQTTVGVGTRLDWTFAPTLSLQLYARPFISAGNFERFKELEAPRTFDFAEYGKDRGTIATNTACGTTQASPDVYAVDPDGAGPSSCFTFDDMDFNDRSIRGSAVLRWEYRPGSALFAVWQQERASFEPLGRFDARADARELFGAPARNVFLVKMTYWLSL